MHSIVIARYNENLDWILKVPSEFDIYIYNKGEHIENDLVVKRAKTIEDRHNIGRESEAYLHHILKERPDGNGYTIFSPGSPLEHSPDFLSLLEHWRQWDELQPLSWQWRSDLDIPPVSLLQEYENGLGGRLRVRPQRFSLQSWGPVDFADPGAVRTGQDYWTSQGLPSDSGNVAAHFLRRCLLGPLADKAEANEIGVFSYGALFAVRDDLISRFPSDSAEALHRLSTGPAVHHYILERLWLHLFGADFQQPVTPRQQLGNAGQPVGAPVGDQSRPYTSQPAPAMRANQAAQAENTGIPHAGRSVLKAVDESALLPKSGFPASIRRKRLFIATGYFASALAATLALQSDPSFDNYLLITVDRQDVRSNVNWAYQMFDGWHSVATVRHVDYYENNSNFVNPFQCAFDEVYSSHFHMAGFVEKKFESAKYFFYEEGISTYAQSMKVRTSRDDLRLYTLMPRLVSQSPFINLPISAKILKSLMEKVGHCYQMPTFSGDNNVILLAVGLPPEYTGSREKSFVSYELIAKRLRSAGFQVWLKPHPRVPIGDIFAGSELERSGVRILETDAPLLEPVIVANQASISAVGSVYSSFLIYAQPIFGVQGFSIPGVVADSLHTSWKSYQDACVPTISEFLTGHDGADRFSA